MTKKPEVSETPSGARKALNISPETVVRAKVGTLWTAGAAIVGCAITCTIYVVRMESKVDQTWTATQGINAKLEQIAPQHAILWEWYSRTASRTAPTMGGP